MNQINMLKWVWLSVAVVVLDQGTKLLASHSLELHQPVSLIPMLNLTLMHNTGAAFSFLSDAGGWQRWLFAAVALVISALVIAWIRKLEAGQSWLAVALALVLGGALGNVWDRITLGYVVDFIDVYYGRWHWPAFNIADSAITIGAAMLIIDSLWGHRRT